MTFNDILSQTIAMLQQHGRVSYRALKRQFALDDDYLEDLKEAILFAHPQVVDEGGRGLVWTVDTTAVSRATDMPAPAPARAPQPTPHPTCRRRFWPPAPLLKANASRSPCSLPISKTRPS